ncbi:MAG: phosphoribosylglycinamide formyltransferase [Melioribacteraceae bacterium]|nr:phosphoribosylglycinamide formyltransferase [Melioribacteraceae bacterium]
MFKLAVFVSGRGSNLLAIASSIENGYLNAEISAVISNNKDCKALEYASVKNIKNFVVSSSESDKDFISYSDLLVQLSELNIDLIVLAGFLKKIPNELIRNYKNKIINIHPALLPSFGGKGMYGSNVHKAVFNSSVKVSGPTVHFVDEIYDNGLIIDQRCADISDVTTFEEIAERVLKLEHKLLPDVIQKFAENKIRIYQNRVFID